MRGIADHGSITIVNAVKPIVGGGYRGVISGPGYGKRVTADCLTVVEAETFLHALNQTVFGSQQERTA